VETFGASCELNSSAKTIDELNDMPVKVVHGATVYLRDAAYVLDQELIILRNNIDLQ